MYHFILINAISPCVTLTNTATKGLITAVERFFVVFTLQNDRRGFS